MSERHQLIKLLAERSVRRGSFILSSGRPSTLYVDARTTTMSPEGLALIGPLALETMRKMKWKVDSIGGLTLGADPVAYSIAAASYRSPPMIRAFTVRKDAKTYGTGKLIEGSFLAGDSVVVAEDVITTGASALRAIEVIANAGGHVVGVLAVVDRDDGGRQAIEGSGCPVISLFTLEEITALVPSANEHQGSAGV